MEIEFLQIEDVLYIHQDQIERYGGELGVRDPGLLDSAIAQPRASFGGNYLHEGPFEMTAAYLFHIVQNHPFIDGNKRTGAAVALTFLDWNGISIRTDEDGLINIALQTAMGNTGKKDIATFFRSLAD